MKISSVKRGHGLGNRRSPKPRIADPIRAAMFRHLSGMDLNHVIDVEENRRHCASFLSESW